MRRKKKLSSKDKAGEGGREGVTGGRVQYPNCLQSERLKERGAFPSIKVITSSFLSLPSHGGAGRFKKDKREREQENASASARQTRNGKKTNPKLIIIKIERQQQE